MATFTDNDPQTRILLGRNRPGACSNSGEKSSFVTFNLKQLNRKRFQDHGPLQKSSGLPAMCVAMEFAYLSLESSGNFLAVAKLVVNNLKTLLSPLEKSSNEPEVIKTFLGEACVRHWLQEPTERFQQTSTAEP